MPSPYEYSLAPTDDLFRFWRSKGQGYTLFLIRCGKGIHVDARALNSHLSNLDDTGEAL